MNNDRERLIISFLTNQIDWTSAKAIASYLGISIRSVKYSISELNSKYPALIYSSSKGYKINKEISKSLLNANDNLSIPLNYEERKNYIIKTILIENQNPTISELSDTLCISPITLQNELAKMRTTLSKYHLNIHTKKDVISITGISKDKRKIIIDLINDEIKTSSFSIDRINELFENIDLKVIEKIVLSVLNKYEFFLDTYSLLNYCLHLALAIEIHKNISNSDLTSMQEMEAINNLSTGKINNIVREIYELLTKVYNLGYSLYDIQQASILMMTRVVTMNIEGIKYEQIESILGKDVNDLLNKILVSVYDTYNINLYNENFLIRFAFHLKNLLLRLQYNVKITNIQFSSIKNDYPLIYAISVFIAKIITQKCGYILSEDEISYICLHIGVLMDEKKAIDGKVKCIIVCPNYYQLGKKIFSKLSEVFHDDLLISNVVTFLSDDAELENVELILSTENINPNIAISHYILSPFVSQNDIQNIFKIVTDIKKQKIQDIIKHNLQYFFHKELFFTNNNFKTDKDAIEKMCNTMEKEGYVDSKYKEQIYEHELISPSSYGNIAIPHPLNNKARSSVIAVALCPSPISWSFNKVNLVFMLSLKEEDKDYFTDIFELIDTILKDENKFNKVIRAKNYDEFINYLISMF